MSSTILITGFEPFPTAPENPTQILIERVKAGEIAAPDGVSLSAHVLPTEYERCWEELKELIKPKRPQAVVSFGLSAKAQGFTLERLARNEISASRGDNKGHRPEAAVVEDGGKAELTTGLPIEAIQHALKQKGLPVDFSDDAGGYVCNYLFYRCLASTLPERPATSGFIHMPYLTEQRERLEAAAAIEPGLSSLTPDELKRGVEIILRVIAEGA